MGATDPKAVDVLRASPRTQVRVSYDTKRTWLYVFAEDVALKSPSADAAVVKAGDLNGRTAWKVLST